MNELFVCIKLDREERPDIDSIYMEACQAMTGAGGWPLNVFLTPEQVPFYAGTYFPPRVAHGHAELARGARGGGGGVGREARRDPRRRRRIARAPARAAPRCAPSTEPLRAGLLDPAVEGLRAQYDSANGGFGSAPKFPPASALEFLLRRGEVEMVAQTLRAMASGGMYDQVGGGFARYSVDPYWLVPHFEKMLYDNALLARAYLHGWQVTGDPLFRRVTEETLDWALREMRAPEGGFYSALDADSEGVEGKFYVWSVDELRAALGASRTPTRRSPGSAPPTAATSRAPTSRCAARARRSGWTSGAGASTTCARERVWPGLDDKRLTSWNALMISALAEAGAVLERADYLEAAARGRRVRAGLAARRGRPPAAHLEGRPGASQRLPRGPRVPARGAADAVRVELRAALVRRGAWRWPTRRSSASATTEHGGFFETSSDHERLLARRKDLEDHPIPSGQRERRVRPAAAGAP